MEKSINVLERIASALDRRDEIPNQGLALEIVENADDEAVKVLIANLANKSMAVQNDCIKVLYEIGERKPDMIAGYIDQFLTLLDHKNNRLQWGSMTALNCIATIRPKEVYENLVEIMDAADKGSVITRDHAVNILIQLAAVREYSGAALDLLVEQLLNSPANQLPMYAERMLPTADQDHKTRIISALHSRLDDLEKESKRKRVEKVIKRLKG